MADTRGIQLAFDCIGQGILFHYECDGQVVLTARRDKGRLTVSILYDYSPVPLALQGAVRDGDRVSLTILPHRIEMTVNDRQADEEWPCGHHMITGARHVGPVECVISPYVEQADTQPDVLGHFVQAEGWKPSDDVFVGDCMPYADAGRYHVLYLRDRHHHKSKWGLGAHQWAHISTSDLINWQIHPMAVCIEDPSEGSICTGSWIKIGGTHYLYYTIRTCDGSPARIARSVSHDGWHFVRDEGFAVYLSERYTGASARDPKVIVDDRGSYHMFLTTTLRAQRRGCLAHLTSADGDAWEEAPEPIYISPTEDEPECCDYIQLNGWHYLIFSLRGVGQYLYSRSPFTDWLTPDDPVIPCKTVPKGAVWDDHIIFAGFDGQGHYAGTMTFLRAYVTEDGQLTYEKGIMP